jgi:hypothetical protein
MSHPQEPSDNKEEAEVKACCGSDKHKHTLKINGGKPNAPEVYCPMHCEGDKARTNQEDVRCVACI